MILVVKRKNMIGQGVIVVLRQTYEWLECDCSCETKNIIVQGVTMIVRQKYDWSRCDCGCKTNILLVRM